MPGTTDPYDQMAADLADSTPKIEALLDKLIANGMPFATMASTASAPVDPLTLDKLKAVIADIPPEPIGEWMREQGFPPETSVLMLPETMRSHLPFWPSYVRFSLGAAEPMLARRPEVGHPAWMNGWRK